METSSRAAHRDRIGAKVWIAIIIVLAAAAIVALSLGSQHIRAISSGSTLSMVKGSPEYFEVSGTQHVFSILLENSSGSGAVVYISRYPVLEGPILNVSINSAEVINVSLEGTQSADLQIKLLSSGSNSASLLMTAVPQTFSIRTSPGIKVLNPTTLSGSESTQQSIPVQGSTTSTLTSTYLATTTVQQPQQNTSLAALALANSTNIGILLNNYKALYNKDTGCTSGIYNSSLLTYAKQSPTGPLSFYNMSRQIPTDITASASKTAAGLYKVVYTTISPSEKSIAVTMYMNSAGAVLNVTYSGTFTGMNYSQLSNSYAFQSGIYNSCAAYIP